MPSKSVQKRTDRLNVSILDALNNIEERSITCIVYILEVKTIFNLLQCVGHPVLAAPPMGLGSVTPEGVSPATPTSPSRSRAQVSKVRRGTGGFIIDLRRTRSVK